jgi:collagen type I/II/III/V/XI/XXIV/XXVII alpha
MDTFTVNRPDAGVADDDPLGDRMPRRPRRQFLNRRSAALAALLTCAVGFYAGAKVEKGQISTTRTFALGSATGATGATGRRAGGAAAGGAATGATGASGATGATGARGAGSAAGGATGGAGAGATGFSFRGGAGGGGSFGTVQSVNGDTLVLTEASGDTVKVRLASSTKVTKSESVKHSAVRPGDTVVVAGAQNSKGTLVAATLTDSGSSGASSTGSSTSGSSGSSGSGVSALFSGGGG